MSQNETAEDRVLSGKAWEDFCDQLKAAGQVILRPEAPATALDRAEGWRYLTRLLRWGFEDNVEFFDPDFPQLYRNVHETVKFGADNPDNIYHNAVIRGDRNYIIRGKRGNAPYMSFGTKANRYHIDGTMASTGEIEAHEMHFEPDGSFELVVSQERPANCRNWLPIAPDTTFMVARESFFQYEGREGSTFKLERIGGPSQPPPLTAEAIDRGLKGAAAFVRGSANTFVDWVEGFRAHPNQMPAQDQTRYIRGGGDPNIHYIHGYWELEPGQALVIDTQVPECAYWNFQLENYWMESMDYRFFPVWFNHETAKYNADGSVTFVISEEDVGSGNWLDTTGHRSGASLLRWVRAKNFPTPRCRVASISELKAKD